MHGFELENLLKNPPKNLVENREAYNQVFNKIIAADFSNKQEELLTFKVESFLNDNSAKLLKKRESGEIYRVKTPKGTIAVDSNRLDDRTMYSCRNNRLLLVLKIIKNNKRITIKQVVERLGVTERTIQRYGAILEKFDLIEYSRGNRKYGKNESKDGVLIWKEEEN